MAEILVEPDNRDPKKNNSSIWPWILGALLLFGLIWVIVEVTDDDDAERVATTTVMDREPVTNETYTDNTYEQTAAAGPVAEFVRFANEENANQAEMGLDHEYTSNGIMKLSGALNALADNAAGDVNIEQKRQKFRENADKVQQDPQSLQHANIIRETFISASDLIASIKEKSYAESDVDVEQLRSTAEEIDTNTPTLEQKDKVKEYFDKAGDAIEKMSNETTAGVNNEMNR